jgi:hypothetical protein
MNAVVSSLAADMPVQHEMFGMAPLLKAPPLCRTIIVGAQRASKAKPAKEQSAQQAQETAAAPLDEQSANPLAAAQARYINQMHYAEMERIARTPIIPSHWFKGKLQITPEDTGDHKAGRPKVNVRKTLSMSDLDNSITYLQRRTRELQKLVRGTQPSEAHTSKIVSAVIKDAIRKLCVNLPEEKREAMDEVVSTL